MKTFEAIDVLFVILPDTLLLDWAGPAEALRMANDAHRSQRRPVPFNLRFVGPRTNARSSVDAMIGNLGPLPRELPRRAWIVLSGTPSRQVHAEASANKAVIDWLKGLELNEDRQLVTICSGALLAARAGLLRGRSATTHHQHLDDLRTLDPECSVIQNRVFVNDGNVWSSAGVTTGVDLALHLIATECGASLAAVIAQTMVVALRRGPNDPELSPLLRYRNHMHAAVHRVQDAVSEAPQQNWTLTKMANVAHTSSRHVTRLFIEHAGVTPLQYVRGIRVAIAELSLRAGHNVTRAAELAGFRSDTQLRRAWRGLGLAGTPSTAAHD